ncbi:hypothetical protein L6164_007987 [Bauhinia variegata]|uniref:Uncharacterized protein n=1 Tax=Bauhinia variegata TaxID=167791 RepID=A0ACB9PF19_BAUVA|nr:hypothetical protein L6164_007987 [Bauhinia variegata]
MANRLKEDEKNERIIRGLLKLPENRRCINCNSLGPQYVCTNFWTFVCTNCGGIHREFTHRVKSISMAKFTSQEVSALQEGGNKRAKEIYFKEWDAQRQSFPDSSNVDRLRVFIKHVYVDRRFSGERTYDKPPRVDTYQGGSKSPPYEETYERRYSDRSSPGGRSYDERRSPGYDQESRQYGDFKRSPSRPPLVTDWNRTDRFGDRRISDGDYKPEVQSPDRAKDLGSSSPPVVRPVRDILGENAVPLRISEPPKGGSGKAADNSALTQKTTSSSSLASSNGNPVEVKLETTKSLIDFDAEPEAPVGPAIPQVRQTTVAQSLVQPEKSGSETNWASFDAAPEAKANQGPSNVNPLDSVLSQLSVSESAPAGHVLASGLTSTVAASASASNFSTLPTSGASVTAPGLTTVSPLNGPGQWHQQPFYPATVNQSASQQFTPPVGGALNNQAWNIPPAPITQGISMPTPHASHIVSKPASAATSGTVLPSSTMEAKPSGRKELPEDLFTLKYPSFPSPAPRWQIGPPHVMGIQMQYNTVALQPMPSFPQSSKSMNPFDISSEAHPIQTPTFPSMSTLQGALPSISASSGLIHPSSLGNPSLAWMPPQSSSYGSLLPPQIQTHQSAMASGVSVGQQMPTNMPMPRHQEGGSFSTEGAAFGYSNPNQLSGRFQTTATSSNPFPAGGNPFG